MLRARSPRWVDPTLPDFSVRGAEQLVRLSRKLKAVGDKDLSREVRAGLREATTPVKAAIREYAESNLPRRGGLNQVMARSRISTQIRGSGRSPGVRLTSKSHDPRIDRGRLRHPVFGNRQVWVTQRVDPGWFTKPASRAAPRAQGALIIAMRRIEKELESR